VTATVVDTQELLETVLYSSVAGVGITLIFSLGIYGSTRLADYSRDGRRLVATLATVVIGIVVMTQK
jgi:hypothetical protein